MFRLSLIAKAIIKNRIIDADRSVEEKVVNEYLDNYLHDNTCKSFNQLYTEVVNDYLRRKAAISF